MDKFDLDADIMACMDETMEGLHDAGLVTDAELDEFKHGEAVHA